MQGCNESQCISGLRAFSFFGLRAQLSAGDSAFTLAGTSSIYGNISITSRLFYLLPHQSMPLWIKSILCPKPACRDISCTLWRAVYLMEINSCDSNLKFKSVSLERRWRAYLTINCSLCFQSLLYFLFCIQPWKGQAWGREQNPALIF